MCGYLFTEVSGCECSDLIFVLTSTYIMHILDWLYAEYRVIIVTLGITPRNVDQPFALTGFIFIRHLVSPPPVSPIKMKIKRIRKKKSRK